MKSKKKRNISDTNLLLTITIVVFFAMYIGAMVSITNIKRIISSICVLFPLFSFLLLIICSPPITYFFDRFF